VKLGPLSEGSATPGGGAGRVRLSGIGLRSEHYRSLLAQTPDVAWLEVHSENYFGDGGQPLYFLERARALYPASLHGVGLSLGSCDPLDRQHLERLRTLADRVDPMFVSEHVCWCSVGGRFLNDLLPLPYTEEALAHVAERIAAVQDFLGREILVENVSSYLRYRHDSIPEWEFLAELSARSGCALLLDVNNIYVSAQNHSFDPQRFIDAIPAQRVREIHLAGFEEADGILIDTHSRPVHDAVWDLYRYAIRRLGPRHTLIEWDADLPPLETLVAQAQQAEDIMLQHYAVAA
jgi:hypothetical protein